MRYYIKDWFSKLKHSDLFTVIIDESNNKVIQSNNSDSELETSSTSDYEEANAENSYKKNISFTEETNTWFQPIYAFFVFNCYLFCFLTNFYNSEHRLSGSLFLLSVTVILTCLIFYYPTYTLSIQGYINLRLLKWIYCCLSLSIFLTIVRNQPQSCSSLFVSASVGAKIFRELPYSFPKTFTYNELVLIASILSNALLCFFMHFSSTIPTYNEEVFVVEQAICWLVLMAFFTANFPLFNSSMLAFITIGVILLALQFTPACIFIMKQNPFIWLLDYIFNKGYTRIYLFIYWIGLFNCLAIVIIVQKFLINDKKKFDKCVSKDSEVDENVEKIAKTTDTPEYNHTLLTSMRKLFHFLICLVYSLGFYYDRNLLFLCSYGMLIVLVLCEIIRYHKIGVLSGYIEDISSVFIDEKDSKSKLVLSHIYLLVGLSFPLWISNFEIFNLGQLSGLITVGVGDSFASLIGSRFGKHKLPGSKKKSLEGSLGLIFSELFVLLVLAELGLFDPFNLSNIASTSCFLLITAFVEAYTNDNDNLILPIVAYPFLKSLAV